MSPPEAVISHVVAMKAEEVVAPVAGAEVAAGGAAAEPEVIKKGKKEEEGGRGRRQEEEEIAQRPARRCQPSMPDEIEFLVVGLGNPGEEYENTPHNLGFMVIDRLAESHGIRVSRKENTSFVGLGMAENGWHWRSRRRI